MRHKVKNSIRLKSETGLQLKKSDDDVDSNRYWEAIRE
jgi:hypothetical protein